MRSTPGVVRQGAATVATRARGRTSTLVAGTTLAELARARDPHALGELLTRAGIGAFPPEGPSADALDRIARDRVASDFAVLDRWTDALGPLELDEDRRSLRVLVRGLAGGLLTHRRLAGCVPTSSLPAALLATLAGAPDVAGLAALLVRHAHPLAPALAPRGDVATPTGSARAPIDLLELELQLSRRFAEVARSSDRALRIHVGQVIDADNAGAALELASRGGGLDPERVFVPGGTALTREAFLAAARGPAGAARDRLAVAFAGTPLAAAMFESSPAALEDAALAWHRQTQARLRRTEPLGLAAAIDLVLRRRDEARQLRRLGWRLALGGQP